MQMRLLSVAAALTVGIAAPAQAHTISELEAWQADWQTRIPATGMTTELAEEWADMMSRHEWYWIPPTTTPGAPTPPSPSSGDVVAGVEQWRSLVTAYFPAAQVERALCIMWHESRGDPTATNPTSAAAGLFQHLPKYWADRSSAAGWTGASIYDPTANVAVAAWLQGRGGWGHWSPWNRGLCR